MIMATAALHVLAGPLPTKKTQEAAVSVFDAIALAGEWEGYQVASANIVGLAAGHRCMEIELTPETLGPWSVPRCRLLFLSRDQVKELDKRALQQRSVVTAEKQRKLERQRPASPPRRSPQIHRDGDIQGGMGNSKLQKKRDPNDKTT